MSELEVACKKLGISIDSIHLSLGKDKKGWLRDVWSCTLHFQGKTMNTEFKTGIGHRVLAKYVKRSGERFSLNNNLVVAYSSEEAAAKNMLVLPRHTEGEKKGVIKGPSVADVISCLLHSVGCIEMSFANWVEEYGYDKDSLSALKTYLHCQEEADKVYKFLNETVEELRYLEH